MLWRGLVWFKANALARRIHHPLCVQHGQATAHGLEKEGGQDTQPTVVKLPWGGGEQHVRRVVWGRGEEKG